MPVKDAPAGSIDTRPRLRNSSDGTHNPMALLFGVLKRADVPLLQRMDTRLGLTRGASWRRWARRWVGRAIN